MPVASNDKFITELMQVLGLPKHTSAFSLHAAVGKPVVVECTYYPDPKNNTVLTERFTLERLEAQEPAA